MLLAKLNTGGDTLDVPKKKVASSKALFPLFHVLDTSFPAARRGPVGVGPTRSDVRCECELVLIDTRPAASEETGGGEREDGT